MSERRKQGSGEFPMHPLEEKEALPSRTWFLDIARAVCDPACRESFDGKHAAWCHGRVIMDIYENEAHEIGRKL